MAQHTPSPPPLSTPVDLHHLLIDSVIDYAIFILDVRGCIVTWNRGAERLYAYPAADIIGRHVSALHPKGDSELDAAKHALDEAAAHGRAESEGWRIRQNGSRFYASVLVTALRDDSSTLLGFAKITRDLTAQRESSERERHLQRARESTIQAVERSEELQSLNEQLQQQAAELEAQTEEAESLSADLEESNEELHKINDQLHRALDAASFLAQAAELLAGSLDYQQTLRTVARSAVPRLGDWCAVDMLANPGSKDWPPKMERLAVVHQDPAKVKWAEQLEDVVPTDWSSATGLPRVIREGVTEYYPVVDDAMLVASAPTPEALAALRQLGFSSVLVVPLIARGTTLGALTLVQAESARHYDLADKSLAESLAQRAALAVDNARLYSAAEDARRDAEDANRAKGQFLARMSHELRTPLNAIAGYAELLEMGLHGPLTDAQRDAIHRVQRSQRILLGLIEDVLNFARLESGRIEYRYANVSLHDVLDGLEAIIEPQLVEKRLEYEYACVDGGVTVRVDREKLEQIMLNLLINAIKFTDRGKISVSCDVESDAVRVNVTDTGIGVPADKLQAIFDPFVQAEPALTRTSHGSGLGLAISRELARAMGGDVTVTSTMGKGSTFSVRVPRS